MKKIQVEKLTNATLVDEHFTPARLKEMGGDPKLGVTACFVFVLEKTDDGFSVHNRITALVKNLSTLDGDHLKDFMSKEREVMEISTTEAVREYLGKWTEETGEPVGSDRFWRTLARVSFALLEFSNFLPDYIKMLAAKGVDPSDVPDLVGSAADGSMIALIDMAPDDRITISDRMVLRVNGKSDISDRTTVFGMSEEPDKELVLTTMTADELFAVMDADRIETEMKGMIN